MEIREAVKGQKLTVAVTSVVSFCISMQCDAPIAPSGNSTECVKDQF
jgi:hypothetical protein